MIKKVKPNTVSGGKLIIFPHCDPRVLHAPGECSICDGYSEWQQLRQAWGICFTGYEPESDRELPDPSTRLRPLETIEKWSGNTPVVTSQFNV